MTPLDIITLDQAKTYLVMDGIDDRDAEITRLIETAIAMVENYTDYYLYERTQGFVTFGECTALVQYPIVIDSVKNSDGDVIYYRTTQSPLQLNLFTKCNANVELTVGYDDITLIPQPLITGAYKIITYLFENKDIYEVAMPLDVQLLLNSYRRSATI